jgi:hypothetical protein
MSSQTIMQLILWEEKKYKLRGNKKAREQLKKKGKKL